MAAKVSLQEIQEKLVKIDDKLRERAIEKALSEPKTKAPRSPEKVLRNVVLTEGLWERHVER